MNSVVVMSSSNVFESTIESDDHMLDPSSEIDSMHCAMDGCNTWKWSKASICWIQHIRQRSFNYCTLVSDWVASIASNILCRFGWAEKIQTLSTVPIMLCMLVSFNDFTTARFKQCEAQWRYRASGYSLDIRAAAPLVQHASSSIISLATHLPEVHSLWTEKA